MTKRLQKELQEFMTNPQDWCTVSLASDDNMFLWRAEIIGPVRSENILKFMNCRIKVPMKKASLNWRSKYLLTILLNHLK